MYSILLYKVLSLKNFKIIKGVTNIKNLSKSLKQHMCKYFEIFYQFINFRIWLVAF